MRDDLYTTITVSISYRDNPFFESKQELTIAVKLREVEKMANDIFQFSLFRVNQNENPSA
jgi:hypothetical protein